ncbi:MAG TPA: hypothetical protein VD839_09250 [Burkholderiales bacterium]|jgi:hypothetical protein|nr:hypothetical protein [Burkholderiales bacterium]
MTKSSRTLIQVRAAIVAGLAALAVALPVQAADERTQSDLDSALEQMLTPEAWLGGRITEADVERLFAYLRASLLASTYGHEVPVPEELKRRAESLGRELRAHGILAGLLLLQALEARAKQALPPPRSDVPPSGRI